MNEQRACLALHGLGGKGQHRWVGQQVAVQCTMVFQGSEPRLMPALFGEQPVRIMALH